MNIPLNIWTGSQTYDIGKFSLNFASWLMVNFGDPKNLLNLGTLCAKPLEHLLWEQRQMH